VYLAACTTSKAVLARPTSWNLKLEDQSHHDVVVQFSRHSSGLVQLCVGTQYVFLRRQHMHCTCPLSVSAEKLGTLVPTIEKKSTDIPVFTHVYVMNYIHGSMWNSALGAWEDDVAIAG
jgi:hypothetical protein